jgi:tetratricopeptide (TPR) repeat protein
VPGEIAGYRILRQIGAGGMGTVFEAHEEKMNRRVALKVLSRHSRLSEKGQDRFAREAWIGGRLNHPNLIKVYERGELDDLLFYSMELVDGGSLGDVIENLKRWGKDERWGLELGSRRYVEWAITQVVSAARGVHYAHQQGVIHRDIKPMNILLNRDPLMVKIVDFGVAVDSQATRLTTEGKLMGTVVYMAPEQIVGRPGDIDARTDVYALGVTLFELLTLELPFSGDTQQGYMNAVLTSEARSPSKLNERVSRDLEVVLQKALEKRAGDRYASAAELADDLENVLHFRPIVARPVTLPSRVWRWVQRRPMHAALVGVLAFGLPTIAVLGIRALQHQRLIEELEIEGLRRTARSLSHQARYGEMLDSLDRILRRRPDDSRSLLDRTLAYDRLAAAERDPWRREELHELAVADATRLVDLVPRASWPLRVRAFVLGNAGRTTEAGRDERAAAGAASVPDPIERTIDGTLALLRNEPGRAVELFSAVLRDQPDAVETRLSRALAYEELGDSASARTDYEVLVALRPDDVLVLHNLGRLLTNAGQLEEGAAQLVRARAIDPRDAQIHVTLADNLFRQARAKTAAGDTAGALHDLDEAEASARRSIELDTDQPSARVNLGAILVGQARLRGASDRGAFDEAIAEYERVIALHESGRRRDDLAFASALLNQCDALIELRDLGRALHTCRRIAELEPHNANNHYNLAGVYALLGRTDDALVELERDFESGDRDHAYLSADAWFVSLRRNPRFVALLERMRHEPTP